MLSKKWKEFVKKAKKNYNKIQCISCPAFNNEFIYFNREGFNHLLWKGTAPRSIKEQKERISLISAAVTILKSHKNYSTYRMNIKDNSNAHFWSFDGRYGNKEITIILRQINDGNKYFFSVFCKK